MLAQTIAAVTIGSGSYGSPATSCPTTARPGRRWPYRRLRCSFEVQDITKTNELAEIVRLVKKQYTANEGQRAAGEE